MPSATPQRSLFPEGGIGGKRVKYRARTPKTRNPDFFYFLGGLGGERHSNGFPDPVGSILSQKCAKRSHGDLIRMVVHVFHQKSGSLSVHQTQCLSVQQTQCVSVHSHSVSLSLSLCNRHSGLRAGRAGAADSRKVWACWFLHLSLIMLGIASPPLRGEDLSEHGRYFAPY